RLAAAGEVDPHGKPAGRADRRSAGRNAWIWRDQSLALDGSKLRAAARSSWHGLQGSHLRVQHLAADWFGCRPRARVAIAQAKLARVAQGRRTRRQPRTVS